MSAEGPVRKPSSSGVDSVRASDPPDVDSLMSRLDGDEPEPPVSDPGDGNRPSAAELLGGRGRGRTKRTIRVPDDAVPAGTPPTSSRRSNPPPALPASLPQPIAEDLLQKASFIPLTPQ